MTNCVTDYNLYYERRDWIEINGFDLLISKFFLSIQNYFYFIGMTSVSTILYVPYIELCISSGILNLSNLIIFQIVRGPRGYELDKYCNSP